ncbi:DUF1579 domain-containing protein [Novipirellula caenicola]|uniref:DUF1579 domain-containing protein n=1 Tax=Novipirellula caenicola TaxID=1536901 RepID=A0ABP9VKW3_9BACT
MKLLMVRSLVAGLLVMAGNLLAQQAEPMPKPTAEHQWLERLSGEWSTDAECKMGPDQPEVQCIGSLSSRMVGGFWLLLEMKSEIAGHTMTGIQTIGFDVGKDKFVGTWIDSSSSFMWKYEGSLDKDKTKLTLEAEGPNFFKEGETATFRDTYEFKSDDEFAMKSQMQGEDGRWITFMTGTATRRN